MVNHHQLVMKCKFWSLSSHYGVEVEEEVQQSRGWTPPLSYRQYLHLLLRKDFWGDEVVLFTVSCLWSVKITVFNSKTLQEYRIRHDRAMEEADIVLVYNGVNHFNAAGKGRFTCRSTVFLPVKLKRINCRSTLRFTMLHQTIHLTIHYFSIEIIRDQPNDPHYIFQ